LTTKQLELLCFHADLGIKIHKIISNHAYLSIGSFNLEGKPCDQFLMSKRSCHQSPLSRNSLSSVSNKNFTKNTNTKMVLC